MDVDAFFSEVDQTQEVYNLRERIKTLEEKLDQTINREQELVSEIDQLRLRPINEYESQQLQDQIETLREHLKENKGTIQYPVNKITPNLNQPRKTFTEEVEAMALSLQREGQLDPVILFEDGMLFDGECRYRAAQILGWGNLEAVFTSKLEDAKTLRRRAYLTSLHRRGLNALDKAETLVAIACDEIPELPPEEVPRIINRVLTRLKRRKQSLGQKLHLQLQEQQQIALAQLELEIVEAQVIALFLELQEHPASLNRNIFPSLNLSLDLKNAVREQALGCAQALILNRISAKELGISEKSALKLRGQGIQKVITENLSTTATQQWVVQQKTRYFKTSILPIQDKKIKRILTIAHDIDLSNTNISVEQRQELKQVLETLLQQLQE
jgi:ParB family chromosome partitioning protein